MLLIIDKTTKEVITCTGTNTAFPDGNIPNLAELPAYQQYIKIHDNSNIAEKIRTAYKYALVFNNDVLIDVNVTKTIAQWQTENPITPELTEEDYLIDLDYRLSKMELKI